MRSITKGQMMGMRRVHRWKLTRHKENLCCTINPVAKAFDHKICQTCIDYVYSDAKGWKVNELYIEAEENTSTISISKSRREPLL